MSDILDFGYYNMDCIEGMRHFPNKYFDLAIVDPVYGDVTKGGYMKDKYNGKKIGAGLAVRKNYHNSLFGNDVLKTIADIIEYDLPDEIQRQMEEDYEKAVAWNEELAKGQDKE